MRRWLLRSCIALIALLLAATLTIFVVLRGSLPDDDSVKSLVGLRASVVVNRDALGTTTIEGRSDEDVARALGYVHAQERFFEMDLARRAAAGELAALFGEAALATDRQRRAHRLRARAMAAMEQIAGERRHVLTAYTEGVNAGLAALWARPFPYLVLGQSPVPWRPEDTALVGFAMFFDLQDESNSRELALWRIREVLPAPLAALLHRDGTDWDAPLFGQPRGDATLPGPALVDLRRLPYPNDADAPSAVAEPAAPGSNNFAVAGGASVDGRALVADDMHLSLRVPGVWFRARLIHPDHHAPGGGVDVSGVSLPGIPAIIVGSNTHVAWGFTNSYGDWLDWVRVDFTDSRKTAYRTLDGEEPVLRFRERIDVAGREPVWLDLRETRWGPLLHDQKDGSALALRWTAHLPGALDLGLGRMASAGTIDDALAIAANAGIPAQNIVVGDRQGRIGWRLAGRLPHRIGECDPTAPLRPLDGCDWNGFLSPDATRDLALVDPQNHRLWTANARVLDGDALAKVGDGGYALGARARQIADGLAAREQLTEHDLLAIQLDERAFFLERWNRLLRQTLEDAGANAQPDQVAAAKAWNGRASVDSAGYRYTRGFRLAVLGRIQAGLLGPAKVALGQDYLEPDLPQLEGLAWPLLSERPAHFLPPGFEDWQSLLRDAAHRAAEDIRGSDPRPLDLRHWGERNTARICHPMAMGLPAWLSGLLCMPADPLPGDAQMPRVQGVDFGASQRMVVSPGHEAEGILQVAGGQSGHPLSPYWGAGHADWVEGKPTPFLPGRTRSVLELRPAR